MTITSPVALPDHHPFAGRDVASVFRERCERFGDRPFLAWEPPPGEGRAATWTYTEFAALVERTAAGLAERGVRRGDPVMLLLENSPAFLAVWFACARIGAVAVDTNTRYAVDELAHACRLTEPVGVVTHGHLRDRVEAVGGDRWLVTVDDETWTVPALEGDASALPPPDPPDPAAPMSIQFTSGTTSRPKAALYTHANALWGGRVGASHFGLGPDDVTFIHAPLFHTMALSWQMLATFWAGGTIVLVPKYTHSRFWEISLRHGCTRTFFQAFMMSLADAPIPDHSYRSWIFGGEVPGIEAAFGVRLDSSWGMTEVVTNVLNSDPVVPGTEMVIGRVSPEYSIRVAPLDDDEVDDGPGLVGELRVAGVRGLSLFAGYHRNEEATREGFDADGLWCTGDLVRQLPSGEIQFVSRIKDMLRVGGENVAAAEIERVAAEHPAVVGAGVVAGPDRSRGERPVVFVVAPGAEPDVVSAEVLDLCAERLADFKVPKAVHVLDELPESLIGKVSKKLLREMAMELEAASGTGGA